MSHGFARIATALALALAAGCAAQAPFRAHLESPSFQLRECARWYAALDSEIDAAGVRDAQQTRVPGFPYLRVDRLHAALRPVAARSGEALQAYADRLLALDLEARRFEIANLPQPRFEALTAIPGTTRRQAALRTRDCGRLLREIDLAKPEERERLLRRSSVPDDYSSALRVLGLYAFTRVPFAWGVERWQRSVVSDFAGEGASPQGAVVVRYDPPAGAGPDFAVAAEILARSARDPLGLPDLSEREFALLSSAYAPSFEIEIAGDYDRFGALRWRREAPLPAVEASELAVYRQPAYTIYEGRVLLQLVYTIWFPERPAEGAFDILAGKLDGLVWRVTLAPDGEPLVYDSIHPCGCYHMFFPTPRARPTAAPDALEEWAFVPRSLPRARPGERPLVRLATRTHYIQGVSYVRGPESLVRYQFRPYDELRSLPRLDGGSQSLFGPDGLVAGSERSERFLFWPMGIESAGAMRQWGRHATAFVGRRHFDDADLFQRRFEFDLRGSER